MYNWIMIETEPTKEIAVAQALDVLTGGDFSYCPTTTTYRTISRRAGIKKPVTRPVLPRTAFMSASFPDLEAVRDVRGVKRIVLNEYLMPKVIPSWQMLAFMAEVEIYRLRAIHQEMRDTVKEEKVTFNNLEDAARYLKKKAGEKVGEAA